MLPTRAQIFYGGEHFFYPPATCSGEVQINLCCGLCKLAAPSVRTTFPVEVYKPETPVVFIHWREVYALFQSRIFFRERYPCIFRSDSRANLAENFKVKGIIFFRAQLVNIRRPHHVLNHFRPLLFRHLRIDSISESSSMSTSRSASCVYNSVQTLPCWCGDARNWQRILPPPETSASTPYSRTYSNAGVGHREQLAEFDLRGLLGLACLAEPDLPAGERVGSGVYLGASGSVRQLLYVSAQGASHDIDDPVHDLTRNSN